MIQVAAAGGKLCDSLSRHINKIYKNTFFCYIRSIHRKRVNKGLTSWSMAMVIKLQSKNKLQKIWRRRRSLGLQHPWKQLLLTLDGMVNCRLWFCLMKHFYLLYIIFFLFSSSFFPFLSFQCKIFSWCYVQLCAGHHNAIHYSTKRYSYKQKLGVSCSFLCVYHFSLYCIDFCPNENICNNSFIKI